MKRTAHPHVLLLSMLICILTSGCTNDDGIALLPDTGKKADSIAGKTLFVQVDGYLDARGPVGAATSVVAQTETSYTMKGSGIVAGLQNYYVPDTFTSCQSDDDCSAEDVEGVCERDISESHGRCAWPQVLGARNELSIEPLQPGVEMGFILFDVAAFEANGTTISCGGRNVFSSFAVDFVDLEHPMVTADDQAYPAEACGLLFDGPAEEGDYTELAAFGVPRSNGQSSDLAGKYPYTFTFELH